ncbi:hypothetical protein K437DRAFT_260021 [Tilletiaria anomala UBC 951]|uniref:1-phosphatidylinositol-3-phosphate 5-kinase n=1 Tax=Tilletiaria anomala (strain ATCC 24038 / CBS 436.72 / UBC 951) TaxID=1037660 RepID=A0A066V5N4_TILAU|nr:uncharacterized protein K437DRAFT_260021 [Tilletiaria anomala UBC 951]KDN36771.1 hypothetical protein K437DRAFT_260021 [Tilletiaria anomala UBC 951]
MAAASGVGLNDSERLTSFHFLKDKDDTAEATFTFGGVGDFFSKVRSAWVAGTAPKDDARDGADVEALDPVAPQWADVRSPGEAEIICLFLPSREGSVTNDGGSSNRARNTPASSTMPFKGRVKVQPSKSDPNSYKRGHRQAPSLALRTIGSIGLSSSAVASITPAVALTSNHFSYLAGAPSMVDASMMVEDGVSTIADSPSISDRLPQGDGDTQLDHSDDDADEGDVLGSLNVNRRSAYGLGLHRTPSLPSSDSIANGMWGMSTIPGFPLSRGTLADDARSIHSNSAASTRQRGLGSNRYDFQTASSDYGGRTTPTSSAAVHGLQTSADAIWRRIRGEGLSKKFWMADENVKECRECLSYFTPFRRKHHCRLCGQIYCSRCASHIIPGVRFANDGMIRVCNFCMRMLEEYDAEEAGSTFGGTVPVHGEVSLHRRPSLRHTFTGTTKVLPGMISAPLEAQVKAPQSQFAANHLFARANIKSDHGIPHGAVASILRQHERDIRASELGADHGGEVTPGVPDAVNTADVLACSQEGALSSAHDAPAPFRKALREEPSPTLDAEDPAPDSPHPANEPSSGSRAEEAHQQPSTRPSLATQAAVSHALNIPFPKLSTTGDIASDHNVAAFYQTDISSDPRVRLVGEGLSHTRTRLRSRADLLRDDDSLPRSEGRHYMSRKEGTLGFHQEPSSATWQTELSSASLAHLTTMARQTLQHAKIKDVDDWSKVMITLALKAITRVKPNARAGEGMGIRGYVKIKRIPGGKPSDTQYVEGFVCSKHVATKKMAQSLPLSHARVMVIQFPIEFHRPDTQFVSLEPVIAQEQEYTRLLVARILALRPQLLVVEKTVSRLALEMLEDAGVIVVWSLKASAVEAISRCTQADIITSVDRLALEPRLGRATAFDVQTYNIVGVPEASKSLMRFEGLNRNLGSTILLRGAGPESLRRVKVILDLLIFIAYNLRLEEHLMRDENAALQLARELQDTDEVVASTRILAAAKRQKRMAQQEARCIEGAGLSSRTQHILHMYDGILVSASAAVRVPPPYPLAKMREIADHLAHLKKLCDEEEVARIRAEEQHDSAAMTPKAEKSAAEGGLDVSSGKSSACPSPKSKALDLRAIMQKPEEVARRVEFDTERARFRAQMRSWEQYLDRCPDAVTPFAHQRLVMLAVTSCSSTSSPCSGPSLHQVDYYGFGDETLGQYLERHCNDAGLICPANGCDKENLLHYRSYVHNDTRVQVMMERFVCPIPGSEGRLLVWSYCKECGVATSVSPISEETWSYSFAKYLELHFYAADNCRTSVCTHHFFRDHVRYFAYRNLAIRFHTDPIQTLEVTMPNLRLLSRPDLRCKMKNDEALKLQQKSMAYWNSVLARLEALSVEVGVERDQATRQNGQAMLTDLMARFKEDSDQMDSALRKAYLQSSATTALSLNVVVRQLQDKVVQWDVAFVEFERNFLPCEKDVRRLTASHLKRMFSERENAERLGDRLPTAAELDEHAGDSSEAPSRAEGASPPVGTLPNDSSLTVGSEIAAQGIPHPRSSAPPGSPRREGSAAVACGGNTSADESAVESLRPRLPRPLALDESSCTENDLSSNVSGLVKRFEIPAKGKLFASSAAEDTPRLSACRPHMRRLKSEQTPGPVKRIASIPHPMHSDNEDVRTPAAHSQATTPTVSRRGSARDSPIARTAGVQRTRSNSRRLDGDRAPVAKAGPPPSSYRPPRMNETARSGRSNSRPSTNRSGGTLSRKNSSDNERSQPQGPSGSIVKQRPNSKEASKDTVFPSRLPTSTRKDTAGARSKVSTIARHFDRISREAEREREHQRQAMASRARRARPVAFTQARVEVFRSVRDAVKDDESDSDRSSESSKAGDAEDEDEDGTDSETVADHSTASQVVPPTAAGDVDPGDDRPDRLTPPTDVMTIQTRMGGEKGQDPDASSVTSQGQSFMSSTLPTHARSFLLSDGETSGYERGSLIKAISGLWAVRGGEPVPLLEYPMLATEHVFADSQIIVREDEPSSIIAFTLSSKNYSDKLKSLQSSTARLADVDESFMPGDTTESEGWGFVNAPMPSEPNDLEMAMKRAGGTHFRFEFESGSSSFWCRIFFAEQFDALRRSSGCGETIIESLSRCLKWDSSGGKSGAAFLKTRDDRLVVKQLSRYEMDGFSKFAPAYFDYIANCFYRDRPTTLAKIFGCFRIGFKNPQTGKTLKMDCLVMENLFYGREMSKIFDLKGSMRNRHIQQTGRPNEVLQDENLVELAHQNPLFVREHSKRLLRAALWNDSLFLADMNVMDYSLVVGMVKDKSELVVGIIDFVRTYTWDKRVESFVKEAGLLGGTGKGEPTIITPRQYRSRFLAFLDRSFVMTPDAWLPSTWAHQ